MEEKDEIKELENILQHMLNATKGRILSLVGEENIIWVKRLQLIGAAMLLLSMNKLEEAKLVLKRNTDILYPTKEEIEIAKMNED